MPATASGSGSCVVLVRFSALGSFGKLTPRLRERIVALVLLGSASVVVLVAFAVLASASHSPCRSHPGRHPNRGTSSAMRFNKVVRSVALSLGSAFGGLMLAAVG
jgi:hypothetical protein